MPQTALGALVENWSKLLDDSRQGGNIVFEKANFRKRSAS
jgi:hypothetical protein